MWLDGIGCGCLCKIIGDLINNFFVFFFRFQGQTQLFKSKPSDFRMALEEAMLAEDGLLESQLGAEELEITTLEAHPNRLGEVLGPNLDQEYYCQDQVKFNFSSCALCTSL